MDRPLIQAGSAFKKKNPGRAWRAPGFLRLPFDGRESRRKSGFTLAGRPSWRLPDPGWEGDYFFTVALPPRMPKKEARWSIGFGPLSRLATWAALPLRSRLLSALAEIGVLLTTVRELE